MMIDNNLLFRNREASSVDHLSDGTIKFVYKNDEVEYIKNGKYHRIDGPARKYVSGRLEWYYDGLLHNLGGPAVIAANGHQRYFIAGQAATIEMLDWINENNMKYPFTNEQQMLFKLCWSDYIFQE